MHTLYRAHTQNGCINITFEYNLWCIHNIIEQTNCTFRAIRLERVPGAVGGDNKQNIELSILAPHDAYGIDIDSRIRSNFPVRIRAVLDW